MKSRSWLAVILIPLTGCGQASSAFSDGQPPSLADDSGSAPYQPDLPVAPSGDLAAAALDFDGPPALQSSCPPTSAPVVADTTLYGFISAPNPFSPKLCLDPPPEYIQVFSLRLFVHRDVVITVNECWGVEGEAGHPHACMTAPRICAFIEPTVDCKTPFLPPSAPSLPAMHCGSGCSSGYVPGMHFSVYFYSVPPGTYHIVVGSHLKDLPVRVTVELR